MEGGAALSTEKQNESTSSYTYWVRETTQDAAPLPIPKKLTSEDLNNQANIPQTHLGSAWNRASPHPQTTQFKVTSRDPPSISPFVHRDTQIDELEEQFLNCDAMLKVLKDNFLKSSNSNGTTI